MGIPRLFKSRLLGAVAGTAILAAYVVHFAPAMVSEDLETYLRDNDMPLEYKGLLHTKKIRLYDRENQLTIVHYGVMCALGAKNGHNSENYSSCASIMRKALEHPNPVNAFAVHDDRALEDRESYVRPPGHFDVNDFLRAFTGIKDLTYKATSNQIRLSQYLREFVLLHELRHTEQDYNNDSSFCEIDADLFALKTLGDRHKDDPEVVIEMIQVVKAARVIHGLAPDPIFMSAIDPDHMSALAIERGQISPELAKNDEKETKTLTDRLNRLGSLSGRLNSSTVDINFQYHILKSVESDKEQSQHIAPERLALMRIFTRSVEYLNTHTEKPIIAGMQKTKKPDLPVQIYALVLQM